MRRLIAVLLLLLCCGQAKAGHNEPSICLQLPALTGDVTTPAGSCVTSLNVSTIAKVDLSNTTAGALANLLSNAGSAAQVASGQWKFAGLVGIELAGASPIAYLTIGDATNAINNAGAFIAGGASLGTTLNAFNWVGEFRNNSSNVDRLLIGEHRTVAGTDWTTAAWRIQPAVDNSFTGMGGNRGYLEFAHGVAGSYLGVGISGAGNTAPDFVVTPGGGVGIGTLSPDRLLTVSSSTQAYITITGGSSGTNNGPAYLLEETPGTNTLVGGFGNVSGLFGGAFNNDVAVVNYLNTALRFYTNAAERMRIDNTGNVGIGTTSPAAQLDIVAAASVEGLHISNTNATPYAFMMNNITYGTGDSNGFGFLQDNVGKGAIYNHAIRAISIDTTGNVGIGTTTPSTLLQINGGDLTISKGGNSVGAGGVLSFGISTFSTFSPMASISGYFVNTPGGGTELQGDLVFSTRPAGSAGQTMTERVRITNGGGVGIGTTAPGFLLDVNGSFHVNGGSTFSGILNFAGTGTNYLAAGTGDGATYSVYNFALSGWYGMALTDYSGTVHGVYNFRSGDFTTDGIVNFKGIGTNLFAGGVSIGGITKGSGINVGPATGAGNYINIYGTTTVGGTAHVGTNYSSADGSLGLGTFSTPDAVTILPGGNVGIGTSSPAFQLDVNGNTNTKGLRFGGINIGGFTRAQIDTIFGLNNTGSSAFAWNYSGGAGELDLLLNRDGGGVGGFNIYDFPNTSGNPLLLFSLTGAGNGFFLGNVGIGTTAPDQKLSVIYPFAKTDTTQRYIADFTSNDVSNPFGVTIGAIGAATLANRIFTIQSADDNLANGGNISLQPYGGNVGIGMTAPPGYQLDVNGTIRSTGIGSAAASGIGAELGYDSGNTWSFLLSYDRGGSVYKTLRIDASNLQFAISGSEKLRIDSSGNVGIGTTSPEVGLSVSGTSSYGLIHANSNLTNGESGISFKSADDTNGSVGQWIIGKNVGLSSDQFSIWNQNISRLVIDTSGKVGIGIISPAAQLDIVAAASVDGLRIINTNATPYALIMNNATYGSGDSNGFGFLQDNAGKGAIYIKAIRSMSFDLVGNVGIGTVSPGAALDVNAGASVEGFHVTNTNATPYAIMMNNTTYGSGDSNGFGFLQDNVGKGAIYSSAIRAISIDTAGNVGIGTVSPTTNLEVNGGLRAVFYAAKADSAQHSLTNAAATFVGGIGTQKWVDAGSNVTDMGVLAQANMKFYTNGSTTPSLTISTTGGITTPSLPTSAGAGGLYDCVDSAGVHYKKAACP